MRAALRATASLTLAAVVAGCGTTVPTTLGAPSSAGDGLAAPSAPAAGLALGESTLSGGTTAGTDSLVVAPGAEAGAAPGAATGSNAALGPGAPGATPASAGGTGSRGAGLAPGITRDSILVGLYKVKNPGSTAGTVTGNDPTAPGPSNEQLLIEDINRRGGILGRKIVPVYYEFDDATYQSVTARDQAACARWTEDTRVFAVLEQPSGNGVLLECLRKHQVVLISGSITEFDDEAFRRHPWYVESSALTLSAQPRPYVDGLVAQGLLTKSSTIGLLTFDAPQFQRLVDQHFLPALARHGMRASVRQIRFAETKDELTDVAAQVSAAVLRFRSDGVDRVLFQDVAGLLALLFMRQADSQAYYPTYGLNSQSAPGELVALVPRSQLRNSRVVGWLPTTDVSSPRAQPPPEHDACLKRLGKLAASPNDKHFATDACDMLNLFQQVMERLGSHPTPDAFIQAATALGTDFRPATTYRTRFDKSRRWGASAVRYSRFDDACGCYVYADTRTYEIP